jgi:predicted phage tail protein
MTQVKLLGELGDKFGSDWSSNSKSMRDIFKLIDCQVEGFKEYLQDCHEKNIGFTIQNGEDFIDYEDLVLCQVKDTVIISAVPAGSGKGLGKILAAIAVIALIFIFPATLIVGEAALTATTMGQAFNAIAAGGLTIPGNLVVALGANLAIAGLTEMSAPDAGGMTSDPSFLFNGADNSIEQGKPVPILYGKMKIGGTPISQQFTPGRIKNERGYVYLSGDTDYTGGRYVGSSSGGTIGGNVGAAAGDSGDIDGSSAYIVQDPD